MCRFNSNDTILTKKKMSTIDEEDEVLTPPFDSSERKSPIVVATFNLVATIVGGGVLSLPWAFAKCGVLLATILMIIAAVVTNKSLYMLVKCGRKAGVNTYGDVGKAAFGSWMEWFIPCLLFVFLLFVIVAYMVLIREIWTPIIVLIIQFWWKWTNNNDDNDDALFPSFDDESKNADLVLFCIVLFMLPFLVQKTLHSLRFNCYLGFFSVSILCAALCRRAYQQQELFYSSAADDKYQIRWVQPSSFKDVIVAFPVIVLSFLCHFNILSIDSALTKPTPKRMKSVLDYSIVVSLVLQYCVGLAGYVFTGDDRIRQNILQNCNIDDALFALGRFGCGMTMMLAMPIITLPCRDNMLQTLDLCVLPTLMRLFSKKNKHHHSLVVDEESGTVAEEGTPLLQIGESGSYNLTSAPKKLVPFLLRENKVAHYFSTVAIVGSCYTAAVGATDVAVVWSLCGSTMAFLIAFILPSACYIRIFGRRGAAKQENDNINNSNKEQRFLVRLAWCLLIAAGASAMICTTITVENVFISS